MVRVYDFWRDPAHDPHDTEEQWARELDSAWSHVEAPAKPKRATKKAGVKCESIHATSDYPEDDILKIAARKKCDLIVMGTHGQGGLRGVFVGSVTQKVLGKSKIPVMVVQ